VGIWGGGAELANLEAGLPGAEGALAGS
jgi:hypothetical protein